MIGLLPDIPLERIKLATSVSGKMRRGLKTSRLREGEEGLEFVLAWEKETEGDHDIVITETDVANLIRSKGAVYAGAAVLARSMGLQFEDLGDVFIAGGFGNYLNVEKAIMIGLLPDIPLVAPMVTSLILPTHFSLTSSNGMISLLKTGLSIKL